MLAADNKDRLERIEGVAVPFDYSSVDTDAMFPVSAEGVAAELGYGAALFGRWKADPAFILHRPEYEDANILIAGPQFGIGSSRETAVWALKGAGFAAVLAPSFGDIFRSNCVRNGVLTATVAQEGIDRLFQWLVLHPGASLVIDLLHSMVSDPGGEASEPIVIDGFARRCLVEGIDEFSLLAEYRPVIANTLERIGSWTPNTMLVSQSDPSGRSV